MFNTKHTAINPSGTKKFDANWDFQQKRNFRKEGFVYGQNYIV